eukprot:scaffold143821_cov24-Tisochrysis_lutea.AAC.1
MQRFQANDGSVAQLAWGNLLPGADGSPARAAGAATYRCYRSRRCGTASTQCASSPVPRAHRPGSGSG